VASIDVDPKAQSSFHYAVQPEEHVPGTNPKQTRGWNQVLESGLADDKFSEKGAI
jgi:hypothetical protein